MRPAMYSLRISDLRSRSRYSLGPMRLGFGDDMGAVCASSNGRRKSDGTDYDRCILTYGTWSTRRQTQLRTRNDTRRQNRRDCQQSARTTKTMLQRPAVKGTGYI